MAYNSRDCSGLSLKEQALQIDKLWSSVNTLRDLITSPWTDASICCYDDTKAQNAVGAILQDTPSVDFTFDAVNRIISATVPVQWVRDLFSAAGALVYDATTGQFSVNVPVITADNGLTKTLDNIQLGGTLLHNTLILGGTSAQVAADTHYGMMWSDMNYYLVQGRVESGPGKSGQPTFQMVLNDNTFTYKFFAADNDKNFYSNWNGSSFMEQINDHGNFQLERYSGVSSTGIDLSYLKHGYEAEYMTWDPTGVYEIDTTEAWMMIKGSGGKGRIKLLHLSQGQVQPSDGGNGDWYATGYLATEQAVRLFCGKIDEAQMPWYDDPTQLAYQKGIKINYGGDLTFGTYPNTRMDAGTPSKVLTTDASGNVLLQALPAASVTANNGLSVNTEVVQLGGVLNKYTLIDTNSYVFSLRLNNFGGNDGYTETLTSDFTAYDTYAHLTLNSSTGNQASLQLTRAEDGEMRLHQFYMDGADRNMSAINFGSGTTVSGATSNYVNVGTWGMGGTNSKYNRVRVDWEGVKLQTYVAGVWRSVHIKSSDGAVSSITVDPELLPVHADNAAATAAGVAVNTMYRTATGAMMIRY